MPRSLLAVLLAILCLTVAACGGNDDPGPAPPVEDTPEATGDGQAEAPAAEGCPRLSTRDGKIVDTAGEEVLLRGVNMFSGIEDGEGVPAGELRRAARQGFNVVRLVAYWDTLEPEPPSGGRRQYNDGAWKALDDVIARARQAGLYVILDPVHLFDVSPAFGGRGIPAWVYEGRGLDLQGARDRLASDERVHEHLHVLLRRIARRYADDPAVAAIDPVNEPPSPDLGAIATWYGSMVELIRKEAPDTMVFVEPQFGDYAADKFDFSRIGDLRNVVYSTHFYYAGGKDDGYGPQGNKEGRYVFDGKTGYEHGNEGDLEAHLQVSLGAAAKAGVPVHVSEFGIGRLQSNAMGYVEDLTRLFDRKGVGWAYWIHQAADKFSLTEDDGTYDELVGPLRRAAAGELRGCNA